MAFVAVPTVARVHGAGDPVARAVAAAGGRELLSRVRAISWTSRNRIVLGGTVVDVLAETRIEPFARWRSDTRLVGEDRTDTRTLMIERDGGFIVQSGAQVPMPGEQARFERQQFGVFAYLLLAQAALATAGPKRLTATHAGFPPIALGLASDGRVAMADYAVPPPGTTNGGMQHFTFSGTVSAQGVRFPRKIAITQAGRDTTTMILDAFSVELMPA
uniref:hypothetical protein n=1 Tax=uncultured Sphingomonas sp. TaxID=158754 RepID=UPI0035CAE6E9